MSLPRVLLVEDNASLQHFVSSAFADLGVELSCCSHVDEALALLRDTQVALILTDLMMPGRSGYDLIQCLADEPALQGQARLVVFSAGLTHQVRERLSQPHVWRLLAKPCSLADLQACVEDALAELALKSSPPDAPPAQTAGPVDASQLTPNHEHTQLLEAAIERNFGGDRAFYETFRSDCLKQFFVDIASGDSACERGDAQALRLVAHSLKSVLLILGHDAEGEIARQLEQAAALQQWDAARQGWQALRQILQNLQAG
ncbi:hypothetical protein DBR47_18400 [Paucibacter sp. KBW04]|uniref:response regulator n=1 Tax=Paucibacter sp. KBW04 TaxID=2153361 RepID=UPI000F56A82D|nr:response regulator [Paucibacter sp. KBW04]RQO55849.1 hypothetical protein DBR47_18400 [Paucibacter sp. KBW04]